MFVAVLLALWLVLWTATGFNFLIEAWKGIVAHRHGPIHMNRSRVAWLFWNLWDICFFFGLVWLPFWTSRRTWRPILRTPLLYALLAMWALVMITDGIRGETARIVMFLYPLLAAALVARGQELLSDRDYMVAGALLGTQSMAFAAVLHVL